MAASALVVEDVVKYFPVPQTGVRAFLNPFSPLTHPALLGVSFQVGVRRSRCPDWRQRFGQIHPATHPGHPAGADAGPRQRFRL